MSPDGNDANRSTRSSGATRARSTDGPFSVAVPSVVTFKAAASGRDEDTHKLRMQLKASYAPPIISLRLNVELFGYGIDRKKARTMLYFNVPCHHIAALDHTALLDVPEARELAQHNLPSGGITQLRFLLKRPGHVVEPIHSPLQTLRPNSQPTRAAIMLLAAAREFVLFVPQNTFSSQQIRCLERAVTHAPVDEQTEHKQHVHWLGTLYGGAGGRELDTHPAVDETTPSESGDSTVPMTSPPGYKRVTERGDPIPSSEDGDEADDAAFATSPPPYKPKDVDPTLPTDRLERRGEKRPLDNEAPTDIHYSRRLAKGPRIADSDPLTPGGPLPPEGIAGATCTKHHGAGSGRGSHGVLVSMLEDILSGIHDLREENGSIKAQLSAIQDSQRQLHARMAEVADLNRQQSEKTRTLETGTAGLSKRCDDMDAEIRKRYDDMGTEMKKRYDDMDGELARIEERVEGTEEQYELVAAEITDQVRGTLREALMDAVGSV